MKSGDQFYSEYAIFDVLIPRVIDLHRYKEDHTNVDHFVVSRDNSNSTFVSITAAPQFLPHTSGNMSISTLCYQSIAKLKVSPKRRSSYFCSGIKERFSAYVYPNYRKPNYRYRKRKTPNIRNVPISYSPLPANHTVVIITAGGKVGIGGMMNGRECLPLSKTR